jgi:hypothetical protein
MCLKNLFDSVVPEPHLHPNFKALRDSNLHVAARSLMNKLYGEMGDSNSHFLRDFQSNGFHSRIFELACFAYLQASDVTVERRFDRPDFMASRDGRTVAIEATTANPSRDQRADISIRGLANLTQEEVFDKVCNDFPIRMANILRKKLGHRYWELPHCSGMPFVLAVSALHEPGSVTFTDDALAGYLYGLVGEHRYAGRGVRSGFFLQPEARHVSAVLYSNQFTVPKFFRLAGEVGCDPSITAIRRGVCYVTSPDSSVDLAEYEYRVGHPTAPEETWWQGVTLFYNPNAEVPLPRPFLSSTSAFSVDNEGTLIREVREFHPVTSFMSFGPGSAQ